MIKIPLLEVNRLVEEALEREQARHRNGVIALSRLELFVFDNFEVEVMFDLVPGSPDISAQFARELEDGIYRLIHGTSYTGN
ncbi:hypothetical protein [Candidatus Desulforudis audaxviator]|uniref:Uncharacterized protein n=1 Tax=Desulforudis audaxviator (strain MP104C) TaxID=477974 RepID=B1I5L7_DESAP|nr:hypothetical protein [Candidatus Desulforudis audaxviator]ACA60331.1 hypothetical protein Daud_1838 [Candidatus Desulforudis audaxviator MP104C]